MSINLPISIPEAILRGRNSTADNWVMTNTLSRIYEGFPEDRQLAVVGLIEWYMEFIERNKHKSDLIPSLYKICNSFIETEKFTLSCKSGCSNCCYTIVCTSSLEASHIKNVVAQNKISIDEDRLSKQVSASTDEQWFRLSKEDRRCIFLSNSGRCKIYDDRPLSCRNFMVSSHPSLCAIPDATVKQWTSIFSEIIASALLSVGENNMQTLPALMR